MKLKSALIICIALIAFSQTSKAQMKTEFGVKGGLNVSGLSLSSAQKLPGVKYNNLKGFHAGVYALVRVGKLGIQPEIIYSQQGQQYNAPTYSNLRTDLAYINIPVMIKYYLAGGLNIQAGPQMSILASAKGDLVTVGYGGVGQPELGKDLKNYVNSTDYSFAFGAGLDLPKGISLGIRYNIGLSNINKYKGGDPSPSFSGATTHNQVLQLSVGYRFLKLGK